MTWKTVSESELLDNINSAYRRMSPAQRRLWEQVKIDPQKWAQHPRGDSGGGFWVAAIVGMQCLFYNDIEDGWNWSDHVTYREILDYWCNQDELEIAIQHLLNQMSSEQFAIPRCGAPLAGPWKNR